MTANLPGCGRNKLRHAGNLVIRIIEDFAMLALALHVMFFNKK